MTAQCKNKYIQFKARPVAYSKCMSISALMHTFCLTILSSLIIVIEEETTREGEQNVIAFLIANLEILMTEFLDELKA